ncbi:MAG: ATP-dependent ligase protein [Paucimonas sp.]|nr:ATP-dependent ligase protein [Paucimonas sp.]
MGLQKYWQKRDFKVTAEPRGVPMESGESLSFVIQRHAARRLHYDFRLELDGVLKSWAVPKGPNFDPAEKRLAVRTEDHPVDYASFEGEIPANEYGAGHVIVWDRGSWTPVGDPHEGLARGNLKFELHGEKLAGRWALVRMHARRGAKDGSDKENWLLIKERDEHALSGADAEVTELQPESVLSGAVGRRKRPAAPKRKNASPAAALSASLTDPKTLPGAQKAALPAKLQPQLAMLAEAAPTGDEWVSEFKFDGYRVLARVEEGEARLLTRSSLDWTAKWPAIARAIEGLPVKNAWFDGEVVALDTDGSISFQQLQNWARRGEKARLACYLFDLLYLDGYDLRRAPLLERKRLLKELMEGQDPQGPLLYSEHIVGHAEDVLRHACEHSMEGIVVKRADAPYHGRRSGSWLKVKCEQRQEFVIAGYTDPAGSRAGFGALLLGVYDDQGQLIYSGRVGTGFDGAALGDLARRFAKLETAKPVFANPPKGSDARGVHWLQPELVAEVRFAQWTDSGSVRHASFIALREDKKPADFRRETASPVRDEEEDRDDPVEVEVVSDAAPAEDADVASPARSRAAKSAAKAAAKSAAKTTAKAAAKAAAKTTTKTTAKAAAKTTAKTTAKATAKTTAEAGAKTTAKPPSPAASVSASATAAKAGAKSATKPTAKPAAEPAAPAERPAKKAAKASASDAPASSARTVITRNAKGVEEARVAGVRLSHPHRVMFEGTSITKLDLAHYYEDIAEWIMPHLVQRPLTVVRCPDSSGKECFYQKHANGTTPADVERIVVADDDSSANYMTAGTLPSLIALVQMGVLELHTWGAHGKQLTKPDRIIFDLDPAPDVAWKQVIEGAQLTRALLDEIGLQSFVKTTGGKGLHVVVPIKPERTWDEIKPFSRAIAVHLEAHLPDRFIANMAKKKRVGKIFVDYLRNGWEATAVSAYSTRTKPGAPVSVPLAWDELSEDLKSDHFTIDTVRERLAKLKVDPWAEYYGMKQRITAAMLRMFGL